VWWGGAPGGCWVGWWGARAPWGVWGFGLGFCGVVGSVVGCWWVCGGGVGWVCWEWLLGGVGSGVVRVWSVWWVFVVLLRWLCVLCWVLGALVGWFDGGGVVALGVRWFRSRLFWPVGGGCTMATVSVSLLIVLSGWVQGSGSVGGWWLVGEWSVDCRQRCFCWVGRCVVGGVGLLG